MRHSENLAVALPTLDPNKEFTVRVLGIDPGLTRCGFGIIDGTSTGKAVVVEVGVFRSDAAAPIEQRLLDIDTSLSSVFEKFSPEDRKSTRLNSSHT